MSRRKMDLYEVRISLLFFLNLLFLLPPTLFHAKAATQVWYFLHFPSVFSWETYTNTFFCSIHTSGTTCRQTPGSSVRIRLWRPKEQAVITSAGGLWLASTFSSEGVTGRGRHKQFDSLNHDLCIVKLS